MGIVILNLNYHFYIKILQNINIYEYALQNYDFFNLRSKDFEALLNINARPIYKRVL